nr:unnamed protein product [Callosobruchus chinensis]
MRRDRFDMILSNLHANDNSKIPADNQDKLYKLRPFMDKVNETFEKLYQGTREVSVDESMILFKGRSSLKQYNPMKPIKRGYKLWCLADQKGYIMAYDVYQGKNQTQSDKFPGFGLGEKVVLSLTEKEWGKNRKKIHASNLTPDKKLKRGDYDYRFSNLDIGIFKWKDNKAIHFCSNYHGTGTTSVKKNKEMDRLLISIVLTSLKTITNIWAG